MKIQTESTDAKIVQGGGMWKGKVTRDEFSRRRNMGRETREDRQGCRVGGLWGKEGLTRGFTGFNGANLIKTWLVGDGCGRQQRARCWRVDRLIWYQRRDGDQSSLETLENGNGREGRRGREEWWKQDGSRTSKMNQRQSCYQINAGI